MSTSSNHARVRQLWRTFVDGWLAQRKSQFNQQCEQTDSESQKEWKKLPDRTRKPLKAFKKERRQDIEKQHYTAAREEWQRRMASAGLRDEDWGELSEAETKSVVNALGDLQLEDQEEGKPGQPTTTMTTTLQLQLQQQQPQQQPDVFGAPPTTATPANFAVSASGSAGSTPGPAGAVGAVQLYSSLSTSSLASSVSMSSYELVNPSDLGSDDEHDDRIFNNLVSSHDLTSEDEDHQELPPLSAINSSWRSIDHQPIGVASSASTTTRFATAPTSASTSNHYANAHAYLTNLTSSSSTASANPNWQSSADSSASGSPAQGLLKSFPFDVAPPHESLFAGSNGFGALNSAASSSSSSLAAAGRMGLTSSAWGSATSTSTTANTNATTATTHPNAAYPPTLPNATSSSTALVVKQLKSSPSASSTSSSSSSSPAARHAYIGPILTDTDHEPPFPAGLYDANGGGTDSAAAAEAEKEHISFERFKLETRISKIIEFHRAAAEMEVRLGLTICRMRFGGHTQHPHALTEVQEREEERRLVQEHEREMRKLQAQKESERKGVVKEERRRRRVVLQMRLGGFGGACVGSGAGSGGMPGGFGTGGGGTGYPRRTAQNVDNSWLDEYDSVQATFDVQVPSLDGVFGGGTAPTAAGTGDSLWQPQQQSQYAQYNQSHQSLHHPASSASTAQANHQQGRSSSSSGQHLHQPNVPPKKPASPEIARPRPMAAWNRIPFMQGWGGV
ncbi:hypothetical protein FA15DRAFT_40434 [Coprinopsis marcescibilis]|uniref:Uncharacterized protein n=1 Tax=Coprinopsis marcescibilis TaxID=230819 RepID=A0A5C3LIS9_COPMA|nr:hypothetical protein FA15DRAFT_40434 [Coprinopsis marcescibilis]